MLNKQ